MIEFPIIPIQILLVFSCLINIIEEIRYIKKNIFAGRTKSFFRMVIIDPIIQESIFRSMLVTITQSNPYYKEINALLFGVMHILIGRFIKTNIGYYISKVIVSTILGYYLIQLDNIEKAICFHMIFNGCAYFAVKIYSRIFPINFEVVDVFPSEFISYQVRKLKRSNSTSDLIGHNKMRYTHKSIKKENIPTDILKSIENFDRSVNDKYFDNFDGTFKI